MSAWSSLLYATLAECVDRSDCFCLPVSLCPSVCVFPCLRYLCVCLSMSVCQCFCQSSSHCAASVCAAQSCVYVCLLFSAYTSSFVWLSASLFVSVFVSVTYVFAHRHSHADIKTQTHKETHTHREPDTGFTRLSISRHLGCNKWHGSLASDAEPPLHAHT